MRKNGSLRGLQQPDGGDFQGVALKVSCDVDAKVVFLVRGFEGFEDLGISLGVELQELLVLGDNAETAGGAL